MKVEVVTALERGLCTFMHLEAVGKINVRVLDVIARVQWRLGRVVGYDRSPPNEQRHGLRSTVDDVGIRNANRTVVSERDLLIRPA